MKVSVAIAAYNNGAYIGAAVDSILAQEFSDFEMVVVDDGSTDRTAEIIGRYDDARLRIVRLPANCGIATARNVAIACASGHYLAVMDGDDVALPGRLGAQVRFLDDHPEVHILGTRTIRVAETVDREIDRPQHPLTDGDIKANLLLLNGTAMVHPTMMMRMSFVREHHLRYPPPPRGVVGIDHQFWIQCVARGAVFQTLQEVLLLKRRHTSNVTLHNADPAIARKKWITRSELLGLYYPQLTGAETKALALVLDPASELSVLDACLGIAAGHKALACTASHYGESKGRLSQIIGTAISSYLDALASRAG